MSKKDIEETIRKSKNTLGELLENYKEITDAIEEINEAKKDLEMQVDLESSTIDFERLSDFVSSQDFYIPEKISEDKYKIYIPDFLDVQVGRYEDTYRGYNVFILDNISKLISPLPSYMEEDDSIQISSRQKFKVKGDLLEFDSEKKGEVEEELEDFVEPGSIQDDRATIKPDKGYEIVRELLDKGEIPFTPQPVQEEDLREEENNIVLDDPRVFPDECKVQTRGFEKWMEMGSITLAYMTGGGKSFVGMKALDKLRYDPEDARKAVVVYSRATKQQWEEQYFKEYAPRLLDEVEIVTYQGLDQLKEQANKGREYIMIFYDECDYLPSPTFSTGATIPTKYRMGASAHPYRKDEKESSVFALTGQPIGLNWKEYIALLGKSFHDVNIHIVDDKKEKIDRMREILNPEKKTMIMCDGLDYGEEISQRLEIPFISGKDDKQLDKIHNSLEENNAVIVSRIGDRGISIKGLQVLLEADFIGDSARQSVQRTGRLLHGEGERHDIFFTPGEFNQYENRVLSLIGKGFELNFVDDVELEIPKKYEKSVKFDHSYQLDIEKGGETPTQDAVEILKHDKIQELIRERIDKYSFTISDELLVEALIAIARSEDGLTDDEVEDLHPDKNYDAYRYFKPFRDVGLVEKQSGRYKINKDNIEEIIEKHEKNKQRKQEIEEIKEELSI